MKITFFETPAFTRYLADYMDDDEYRALQHALMENQAMGEVIQGTG